MESMTKRRASGLRINRGTSGIGGPAIMLVVAAWLIQGGNLMVWTFAESIGEHSGLSAQSTANFLGLSQLMG